MQSAALVMNDQTTNGGKLADCSCINLSAKVL